VKSRKRGGGSLAQHTSKWRRKGGVQVVRGARQKEGWGSGQWQTRGCDGGGVRSMRQGSGTREQRMWRVWASWPWAAGPAGIEGNGPDPRIIGPFLFI
jgi:hypothetical protein